MALPSTAVRPDPGVLLTLGARYPLAFARTIAVAGKLTAPFDLDALGVTDRFLFNYLDLIAFLLQARPRVARCHSPHGTQCARADARRALAAQGLPADGTLTAVMAYMVEDFYREGAVMDFPRGGSAGIVDALARGVTKKSGCSVRTSTPVSEVIVEDGRAAGVKLAYGKRIRARRAVVSNADLHGTFGLVPEGAHAGLDEERAALLPKGTGGGGVPLCKSFMHLHLGIRADAMPKDLPPQWTVVNSWDVREISP